MITVYYYNNYDNCMCGDFDWDYLFPERNLANRMLFDWAFKLFAETDNDIVVVTTSEVIIAALRYVVLNDFKMPNEVVIMYDEEHIIEINTYGVVLEYPEGFLDTLELIEDDILDLAMRKYERDALV